MTSEKLEASNRSLRALPAAGVSARVGATLGQIEVDAHGDHWLHLVGKGSKAGKVALPPLACAALNQG